MKAETYDTIIAALKRIPGGQIEWDAELEKQYALVLRSMSSEVGLAVLRRVIAECEFRPAAAVLVRFAKELQPKQPGNDLPPAVAEAYKLVTPPSRQIAWGPENGEGRKKYEEITAKLKGRFDLERSAGVPAEVLDELERIKARMAAFEPQAEEADRVEEAEKAA